MPFLLSSLRARIIAIFLLSLFVFLGWAMAALGQLKSIGDGIETLNTGLFPLSEEVARIETMAQQLVREQDRVFLEAPDTLRTTTHLAVLHSLQKHIHATQRLFLLLSDRPQMLGSEDEWRQAEHLLAELDRDASGYIAALELLKGEHSDLAFSQLHRNQTNLHLRTGQLATLIDQRILKWGQEISQARRQASTLGGIFAGLATLFTVLLAFVALRILEPLASLTEQVQRLGAGDHDAGDLRVETAGLDAEVAVLAHAFNQMATAVMERDRSLSERARALDRLTERLRSVLDTIDTGLLVIKGGDVQMVNPAAARDWNLKTGDTAPLSLVSLGIGRHLERSVGTQRWNITIAQLGDNQQLIAAEDVTTRVSNRQQLIRSERLAMVGRMFAQITHEVRNPLNAMSLNAELLSDEKLTAEGEDILHLLHQEIRRLEHITEGYLSLSRRRSPIIERLDPMAIVHEVLRTEKSAIEKKGITVMIQGAEIRLSTDPTRLRSIVRNLLRNSVEAGARKIVLQGEITPQTWQLNISDDGVGIKPTEEDRIFDPFYTTKPKGTGLGLAICRQEIEDVGGILERLQTPEDGALFRLTLPRDT